MSDAVLNVTDGNFEQEIVKSDKPALVDFWAPWCGPCKALGPFVEELAGEYKDRAVVAKINIDDNPLTASKYGVRSIPTMILFKNGSVVDTLIGLVPKEKLQEFIKKGF
ncbi:MAG: Thioredoxin 1 [Syntrophus sp. SKADARSKE-3]|nr:Thioredoxin 1 [Syntrophus sp. SKADARSKE-3]